MMYIAVGILILVVVLGSILAALIAMRGEKKSKRITAFGEAPDDVNPPS